MRNSLLTILFIFVAGQISRYDLPWWTLAPIAAAAGWLLPQSAPKSWITGFLGGFLLWSITALLADTANGSLLSARIGKLFMGLSTVELVLLTGIIGGLVAGMSCLTGRWARDLVGQPAKTG